MGDRYVIYRYQGGSVGYTAFDIYSPSTSDPARFENVWSPIYYGYAEGRSPPPPKGMDERIIKLVHYVFTTGNPCSSPDACPDGKDQWPLG